MTERDEINTGLLIKEVQKYPAIWDVHCDHYHARNKKRIAWENVGKIFFEGFDQMDYIEQNESCEKLIKKWRNIKDSYVKCLRRQSKYDTGKRYIYYEQLSFLGTSLASESEASLNGNDDDRSSDQPEDQTEGEHSQYASKKRKQEGESTFSNFKKKPACLATPETDVDRLFFESILPSMKNFEEDKKIKIRFEILNLIQKIMSNQSIQEQSTFQSVPANTSHLLTSKTIHFRDGEASGIAQEIKKSPRSENDMDVDSAFFNLTAAPKLLSKEERMPSNNPWPQLEESYLMFDLMQAIKTNLNRPEADSFDLFGKYIAKRLRALEVKQRILTERLFLETLGDAELGLLTPRKQNT